MSWAVKSPPTNPLQAEPYHVSTKALQITYFIRLIVKFYDFIYLFIHLFIFTDAM